MAAARAPRVSCWYPGDPPINERLHNHWVVNWGKKRTKLGPDGQSKLRSLAQSVLNGPYADDGNLWLNEDAFCQTFIALFLQYGCVVHHTLVNQQPVIDVYQLDPNLLQEHQVPWPTWDQFKIDLIQHVASAQAICQNNGIAEFDWYAAINKAGLAAFQIIGYRMRPIRSLQGWTEYDRLLDTLSQNPTWLDKLDELALAFSRSQAFARATAMGKISTEGTGRFVDPGCLSPNRKALKALFNIQDDGAWDTFRKHTWPAFSDALVRRAVYLQRRDRELGLIYTDPEIGNDLNLLSTATGRLADPEQQYEKPKTEGWTEFGAQKLSPVRQWFKTKLASSRERLHEEEPVIGTILKSATKDQYFNLNRTLNAVQPRNVAPGPAAGAHILGQVAQPEPDLDKDMRNLAAGEKFVHDIREQAADEIEFNFAAEVDMDLDLERILNESASNSEEDEADDRENALPPAAMPTATARDLRAWMVAVEADELFIQTKKWEDVRVLLAALDVASTHGKPGWTASRDQRCFSRGISERSEERLRAKGYVPARVVSALNEEAFLDSWWCINQLLELHPEHLTQDEREDLRQDMALLIAFASVSKIPSLYAQGFDVLLDLYGVRVTKRAKDSGLKTHPEALNLLYGITQLGITCYLSVMCGNRSTVSSLTTYTRSKSSCR
ncbi:hypothetical protein IAU60_003832 [Kwoniella sp. DSM 27419]